MQIEGSWRNEYGSVMDLRMAEGGRLYGAYRSTTGSTGTYHVTGWIDPLDRGPSKGRAIALCVHWRSVGGDPEDSSWHWVSGLGGQLVGEGLAARIILMHDMVATTEFPGQNGIGRHVDKLTFLPFPEAPTSGIATAILAKGDPFAVSPKSGLSRAMDGQWLDSADPGRRLTLRLLDGRLGFTDASLTLAGAAFPLRGFADPGAQGHQFQGLTLAGLVDRESGDTISLSGFLDPSTMVLTLTVFRNSGTAPEWSYTQTKVDQFRFVRA